MNEPDRDVTQLFGAIERGDRDASDQLLVLVYDELRRLARSRMAKEPAGLTIQPTALVHEAYLRLIGGSPVQWDDRGHFFAAAATAMRRILVERARRYRRVKRGGGRKRIDLEDMDVVAAPESVDLVGLDQSLKALEERDPRMAQIVMLRFFAGLGVEETAAALDISPRTVKREWALARAWLFRQMGGEDLQEHPRQE